MSRILLIDGKRVTPLNKTRFTEEGKLQDYLEQYPNLIPLGDIVEGASDLLCIGREVVAGSGSIDLLCTDKDGLLTIIETKLRRNPESRREVVGQIVEYASYVCQWSADDIYRIANGYFLKSNKAPKSYKNRTIDDIMSEIVGDEFSDEEFRISIGQKLRDGKLRLIIAVDELVEQLRATVTFLNSYSSFDLLLLQVSDYQESEARKVLVPLLFGYATKSKETGRQTKQWDDESFLKDTGDKCEPEIADTIVKLYQFSRENADLISWGKGTSYGSFTFRKHKQGIPVSVFTFNSTGWGNICFGELVAKGVKEGIIGNFGTALNKIPGISIPEDAMSLGKFPSVTAEAMTTADNLRSFEEAVLTLCQHIES